MEAWPNEAHLIVVITAFAIIDLQLVLLIILMDRNKKLRNRIQDLETHLDYVKKWP